MNAHPGKVRVVSETGSSKPGKDQAGAEANATKPANNPLETLLFLEGELRSAPSEAAIIYFICNETKRLVASRQCFVFVPGLGKKQMRMRGASNLSRVDQNAPLVRSITRCVREALKNREARKPDATTNSLSELANAPFEVPLKTARGESLLDFPRGLLVPLATADGLVVGHMLLAREEPFNPAEMVLLHRLGGAYAHALSVHNTSRRRARLALRAKRIGLVSLAVLALAMLVPVPMSALAPMEIVPRNPYLVTAPLDGVISKIEVLPNAPVKEGDLLVSLVDTDLAGRLEVAKRNFEVAEARHRRISQGASLSADIRRDLAVTLAELELARSEQETATAQLARSRVYADASGIAIFSDRDDWIGRPVATGERIMEIGNPENLEVEIELGIADASVLGDETTARLFLESDPLNPIDAKVGEASYRAEATSDGRLAYRVIATLEDDVASDPVAAGLRIGLRGTARVSSGKVPLGYYLLRRPLAKLRQWTGL